MNKGTILAGFLALSVAGAAIAAPRFSPSSRKTHVNEGNTRLGGADFVSNSEWTLLASSDTRRRAAVFQNIATGGSILCISTFTSTDACEEDTPGLRLEVGTSLSDSSEMEIYSRAALQIGATVYKFLYYDTADSTTTY